MKENLFLVSYDYDLTKRLARRIAEVFSLRVFDQKELFDFDNMPRTLGDIYDQQGKEYVLKNFRSILKMELDFKNAAFVADISFADNCYDLFYKIKLFNFVVFLHKDAETEFFELKSKKFSNKSEAEFFKMDKSILVERENLIEKDCADISVDITGLSDDEIVKKVLEQMNKFYG